MGTAHADQVRDVQSSQKHKSNRTDFSLSTPHHASFLTARPRCYLDLLKTRIPSLVSSAKYDLQLREAARDSWRRVDGRNVLMMGGCCDLELERWRCDHLGRQDFRLGALICFG